MDGWVEAPATLKPGETVVSYHNLGPDMWFFTPESLYATLVGHTCRMASQFSSRLFGENDSLKLRQPPLSLSVFGATGSEAEAVALLKQGKCRELLKQYPRSRFVDEALRALHFRASPEDRLEIAREQARTNPGSPQLIGWARWIKNQLGVAAYDRFVSELEVDHPNARALEVLKEEK